MCEVLNHFLRFVVFCYPDTPIPPVCAHCHSPASSPMLSFYVPISVTPSIVLSTYYYAFASSSALSNSFAHAYRIHLHNLPGSFSSRKRPRSPYLSPKRLEYSPNLQRAHVPRLRPAPQRLQLPPVTASTQSAPCICEDSSQLLNQENANCTSKPQQPRKRVVSVETRRRISYAMLGKPKSKAMREKVSQSLKGRVPWNKGKKLSPEIRARMSEARAGHPAWNRGKALTLPHRQAISQSMSNIDRKLSHETRQRMRMARRRPGDGIVQGSMRSGMVGNYPLVESADINAYVTLRRELRVWSDNFKRNNSRRPSLADIRRFAPISIIRKFEKYVRMRDQIRGLAGDVYGSVNPNDVPSVSTGEVSSAPQNNSARTIHTTKHGNRRLVSTNADKATDNVGYSDGRHSLEGALEDMWDMYDRPPTRSNTDRDHDNHTLIGATNACKGKDRLGPRDYRMIGRYRLMESMDINRFVSLRHQLQKWSDKFKEKNGRIPALSDARSEGKPVLYHRFCEYLEIRDKMSGLVEEVYGTEVDDLETLVKAKEEGKIILDALRSGVNEVVDDCEGKSQ